MAEIQDILEKNDFKKTIVNLNNAPKKPSRALIELAITNAGIPLPLPNGVSFFMVSANRFHTVVYSKVGDQFLTVELSEAV